MCHTQKSSTGIPIKQMPGHLSQQERTRERQKEKREATRHSQAQTQLKVKECNICLAETEYLTKGMLKSNKLFRRYHSY